MTVAGYIAEFLLAKGVGHVFGYQGSAMLKILDSIVATGKMEYVQGFHEQASAFSADAYARIGGGTAVAVATSGPGASNLVTGIANAYFDSVPVLFLTGQDRRSNIRSEGGRQNGFQDMDIVAMTAKITKRAVQVLDAPSLASELDYCWSLAQEGRKGPVLIDIPVDLQFEEMPVPVVAGSVMHPARDGRIDGRLIDDIADALNSASRPVLLVGGGVRLAGACGELEAFVAKTRIPVVSTLMGLDAVKETSGFAGIYGNGLPNGLLEESDCILALGTRFAFHHTGKRLEVYAPRARVIHVDVDEGELGRVWRDALCVQADLKLFLGFMCERCPAVGSKAWLPSPGSEVSDGSSGIFPVCFLRRLFSEMPSDAVVVGDVGSSQMLVAQNFSPNGTNRLLNSGGLGAMGYALPAAIGASYRSGSAVVAICGDGGFQMNLQELNTLALRKRNVKVFVFNNSVLGLMRGIQKSYYGSRFHGNTPDEFGCPDVCGLAKVFGLRTARFHEGSDLEEVRKIFEDDRPWLVDVVVDPDDIAASRYERSGA